MVSYKSARVIARRWSVDTIHASETRSSKVKPQKLKELATIYQTWADKVKAVPYKNILEARKKQTKVGTTQGGN
jgi:hypothetical protein